MTTLRAEFTPQQKRGRLFLICALSLIAAPFLWNILTHGLMNGADWLRQLVGVGIWALILFFAYQGGSFSLGILKLTSVFLALGHSLVLLGAVAAALELPPKLRADWTPLLLATPQATGSLFLVWAFFFSSSVRDYIQQNNIIRAMPPSHPGLKKNRDRPDHAR